MRYEDMKRVANKVCFQTIGYVMSGFLKLKIGYFDSFRAGLPGEPDYFDKGVTELLYEGNFKNFHGWDYPRLEKTRVNYIGVSEDVLLVGLDRYDRDF